jgi:two-component system, OmpR family, sensor histidine kinase KdpD
VSITLAIRVWRIVASFLLIGAISLLYSRVLAVNSTTVALTFLLAILGIATHWGLVESLGASVLAMLCFNFFFLPPLGTFTIEDPQNWIALLTFVITASVASHLSASEKRRAMEATERRQEVERLYTLSRGLMLIEAPASVPGEIVKQVVQTFELDGAAFFDHAADRVFPAGTWEIANSEQRLRDAAMQATLLRDSEARLTFLPVTLGGQMTGSLGVVGGNVSDTALHAIASLAAVAVERARAQEIAARAEASRQNEEIKSTMLDAMAHEFKTPLTSIKAAASAMLDDGSLDATRRELLSIVDEETDRLNTLVSESLQMVRIEAGELRLRKRPQTVSELIELPLRHMAGALEGRKVEVIAPAGLPQVSADPEFISLVFRQLLDNALKYSPPGTPLTIRAHVESNAMEISVADCGRGIPASEQARVFEKFYRGREMRERIPGTGMGLAIAREIVRAHGGEIRVESNPGEGALFLFTLPLAKGGEAH